MTMDYLHPDMIKQMIGTRDISNAPNSRIKGTFNKKIVKYGQRGKEQDELEYEVVDIFVEVKALKDKTETKLGLIQPSRKRFTSSYESLAKCVNTNKVFAAADFLESLEESKGDRICGFAL
ncbi:hypothetical protein CHS0354_007731 [Potamilus streckersoni]|uniref:Uncharacterized protein n=1 Tax=Potamilus streckersoni TaxID=2493646 RepID=A0AAE0SJ97_9BIVA|nr:hypothetical protein CHS0354_007731 [Potamilus streckersoni]